jgi:hypothetical protein
MVLIIFISLPSLVIAQDAVNNEDDNGLDFNLGLTLESAFIFNDGVSFTPTMGNFYLLMFVDEHIAHGIESSLGLEWSLGDFNYYFSLEYRFLYDLLPNSMWILGPTLNAGIYTTNYNDGFNYGLLSSPSFMVGLDLDSVMLSLEIGPGMSYNISTNDFYINLGLALRFGFFF